MATKRSTNKSSKRVEFDFSIRGEDRSSKRAKKHVSKRVHSFLTILLICVLIGAAISCGACYYMTKDDCFELIGSDHISILSNEVYIDDGVRVVSFNKDLSEKVIIETNLVDKGDGSYSADVDESGEIIYGTYYIKYTVNSIKYGSIFKIAKVRLIDVVEPSESEESVTLGGSHD